MNKSIVFAVVAVLCLPAYGQPAQFLDEALQTAQELPRGQIVTPWIHQRVPMDQLNSQMDAVYSMVHTVGLFVTLPGGVVASAPFDRAWIHYAYPPHQDGLTVSLINHGVAAQYAESDGSLFGVVNDVGDHVASSIALYGEGQSIFESAEQAYYATPWYAGSRRVGELRMPVHIAAVRNQFREPVLGTVAETGRTIRIFPLELVAFQEPFFVQLPKGRTLASGVQGERVTLEKTLDVTHPEPATVQIESGSTVVLDGGFTIRLLKGREVTIVDDQNVIIPAGLHFVYSDVVTDRVVAVTWLGTQSFSSESNVYTALFTTRSAEYHLWRGEPIHPDVALFLDLLFLGNYYLGALEQWGIRHVEFVPNPPAPVIDGKTVIVRSTAADW